jgi:hypothetical protein
MRAPPVPASAPQPAHTRRLRARVAAAIATRLSPDVRGGPRLNRNLELTGKVATAVWVAFVGSVVLGVEWKDIVQETINSGRPLENVVLLTLALPTVAFLAARSLIGFARWRLQRELWRRDVQRLEELRAAERG